MARRVALGLILNREMNTPLQQVWGQVSETECLRTENVRHGGPVSGSLMAVHDLRAHANLVVTDEIYVATELNAMESVAGSEDGQALFYVGHSGWGPGQLETELADGSWLVLPAAAEHVFGDHDTNAALERDDDRGRPPPGSVGCSREARPGQSAAQLTARRAPKNDVGCQVVRIFIGPEQTHQRVIHPQIRPARPRARRGWRPALTLYYRGILPASGPGSN